MLSTSSSNVSSSGASAEADGGNDASLGLSTDLAASKISQAALSGSKASLMAKSNVTNYAFLDEKEKVKIYVKLPGVGSCSDDDVTLDFAERSLCLTIKNYVSSSGGDEKKVEVTDDELVVDTSPDSEKEAEDVVREVQGEEKCLSIGKLFGEIEDATYKKKPDKIIVTLKKKDDRSWARVIC